MKNKEFLSELSQRTGATLKQTRTDIESLISVMGEVFLEGDSVQVPDFGIFEVKKKMERIIVTPTGQRLLVPPKLVLGFKPFNSLKEKIKNGGE